ncbi:MAG TPA: SDR family oxidoreductase [Hyphomicrobiaceae bacterium]|nr:SDR family oxidoreductase [Hyphomicrobiaceae bacterium]
MPMTPGTILITGAARRIGRAMARDFAARGWRVGVHYRRSSEAAIALVSEIKAAGGTAEAFRADLADADAVAALVPRCRDALGAPSCLVNNASEFLFDDVASLAAPLWEAHFAVNLRAPVFLAKVFAEHLPEGTEGNVINIIDQRVLRPGAQFFSYTLAKAALWSATGMLAQALAPRVRVNAIAPGPVLQSVHQTAEEFENERRQTLLRRGTTPAEIAAAVAFILDAPAMTGQMIALDGGQHLVQALAP